MAAEKDDIPEPSGRKIFEDSLSGTQDRPFIPRLRFDSNLTYQPLPRTLEEFRSREGRENRKRRLRDLWHQLSNLNHHGLHANASAEGTPFGGTATSLTPEKAVSLMTIYENELLGRCGGYMSDTVLGWRAFVRYAEAKEAGEWPLTR
jgi:solute carrier family 25 phosphate transporter 23/24/25/41